MSLIDKILILLPFRKEEEAAEYFFALNIGTEKLTAALWTIEGKQLKILNTSSDAYSSQENILHVTDKLLDATLGLRNLEPQKILFGVPENFLSEDDLKQDYLRLLKDLVKELELQPMAYVATSHALIHFLEKQEGIPPTAILVGFEDNHLQVIVVRAGKLDGARVIKRSDKPSLDIEKALLNFTSVETLPSKILIFGLDEVHLEKLKAELLSFPWMSNLNFLHFPKIEILEEEAEIKSICLAGASEIREDVSYTKHSTHETITKPMMMQTSEVEENGKKVMKEDLEKREQSVADSDKEEKEGEQDYLGFVVGDVSKKSKKLEVSEKEEISDEEVKEEETETSEESIVPVPSPEALEIEDFSKDLALPEEETEKKVRARHSKFSLANILKFNIYWLIVLVLVALIGAAYLFLLKATVKVFVEPQILEKDTQVTADPNQKEILEDKKVIPGQIVETEVSGSSKTEATGKKKIGDPAKGTVVIRNKTDEAKTLSKGTVLTSSGGLKFSLDVSVTVASKSAEDGTWGKANGGVSAQSIGAEGNLPSATELTIANFSNNQLIAKAEGNFSGGTSKEVTVVSEADQKKLLAQVAGELRKKAQQKLQEKYPDKKILEEALSEEIIKKNYSKNINDQTPEFSLNLTIKFKGTVFEDKDLKQIISKLVTTELPVGFELKLEDTETQADISKLEKDGKLLFLARFKAKLLPKIDTEQLKRKIKGKPKIEAEAILKNSDHILGSEIKINLSLPKFLEYLPFLEKNIKIEVGLK